MSRMPQPLTLGKRWKKSSQKARKAALFNSMPSTWLMKDARYSRAESRFVFQRAARKDSSTRIRRRVVIIAQPPFTARRFWARA